MPCYEPKFRPKPAVTPWEIAAIITLGVPGIWLLINTFFGAMPVMERLGAVICRHLFGI
jgi:hypothetical protein